MFGRIGANRFAKLPNPKLQIPRSSIGEADPGAFTAPWKTGFNLRWQDGTELFEYVCQQMNYAPMLMVGEGTSIDRTNPIAP